jgi:hypothetical protein
MAKINLVSTNIYSSFYKTDFYDESLFFVVHPDYISHHFKSKGVVPYSHDYYKKINIEIKSKNYSINNQVYSTPSIYLPFIFRNTDILLWKF